MPDYQTETIENTNAVYVKEREIYNDLKNKIDIIIQEKDQYFDILPNEIADQKMPLVVYDEDTEAEEMKGIHCRLKLTDTLDEARSKIF